jgi:hypothetical protein
MHDNFFSPARSLGGSWNSYNLWRSTVEVPRKVQLIATRDALSDDDDESIDRHRKRRSAAFIAIAVIALTMLVASLSATNAMYTEQPGANETLSGEFTAVPS